MKETNKRFKVQLLHLKWSQAKKWRTFRKIATTEGGISWQEVFSPTVIQMHKHVIQIIVQMIGQIGIIILGGPLY